MTLNVKKNVRLYRQSRPICHGRPKTRVADQILDQTLSFFILKNFISNCIQIQKETYFERKNSKVNLRTITHFFLILVPNQGAWVCVFFSDWIIFWCTIGLWGCSYVAKWKNVNNAIKWSKFCWIIYQSRKDFPFNEDEDYYYTDWLLKASSFISWIAMC